MGHSVLALDLGASGGRAMLGSFDGEALGLKELHRFENNPVRMRGTLYWDAPALFREIKRGMEKACAFGGFDSVGIDTWGVDFGLLDHRGNLIQNPVHYRDTRTAGMLEQAAGTVGRERLYRMTGIQLMEINTLFQICALKRDSPELLEQAGCALLMPDLFGYLLTGRKTAEYTIASTTQMLDPVLKGWNRELAGMLRLPDPLFPNLVPPGTVLGPLTQEVCRETGAGGASVISVAGHDTACAVFATPTQEDDFIFISCGTWSLIGTELPAPVVTRQSMEDNLTNEGGYGWSTTFLKNITGLWLIQETRRQYRREGNDYSFDDLERGAAEAPGFLRFIDPNDRMFTAPGDLPARIADLCVRTDQTVPAGMGETMRCIYESLAMEYRCALEQIQRCTGKKYGNIYLMGGGARDAALCQMTADSTGCKVFAGPVEATAMGNAAIQFIALGDIPDRKTARRVIRHSFSPVEYSPKNHEMWDSAYERYCTVTKKQ
jgi:rhamnulokinase/L-fuculokinase